MEEISASEAIASGASEPPPLAVEGAGAAIADDSAGAEEGTAVRSAAGSAKWAGYGVAASRLAAAHLLAYPMLFVAAAAAIPLGILWNEGKLRQLASLQQPNTEAQRWMVRELQLTAADAASFEVIMLSVLWLLAALFLITHLAAIPWAMWAKRAHERPDDPACSAGLVRARKRWMQWSLGATAVVLLVGGYGWFKIMLS